MHDVPCPAADTKPPEGHLCFDPVTAYSLVIFLAHRRHMRREQQDELLQKLPLLCAEAMKKVGKMLGYSFPSTAAAESSEMNRLWPSGASDCGSAPVFQQHLGLAAIAPIW